MTARSSLDRGSVAFTPLGRTPDSVPLGTAYLPDVGLGADLAAVGYREHEFLASGLATLWTYDENGVAVPGREGVPYTTRVLVRAPDASGGALIVEPLHREYDSAPTWRTAGDWIVGTRAVWVGITQDPYAANSMRSEFDPHRYGEVSIPVHGLGFDIVGQVVGALRTGALADVIRSETARRALLSGWSMTGSFCRAFLGDGFHARHRLPDGAPVFDGYLVGISSGAAGRAGYPALSDLAAPLALDDPRRTIGGHDVPVIEFLSEYESETHGPCLRPDADAADDRYRLYQVAGTSHAGFGGWSGATNRAQYRRRGLPVPAREINEQPSDARGEVVARAVFALLDRWASTGEAPPRAARFELTDRPPERPNPTGEARALRRDRFGNALGGIRTPWVDVPVASYAPHSTPKPGSCQPAPGAPTGDAEHVASLLGNMEWLPEATLRDLYGSRRDYLARYAESCRRLLTEGFLLEPDLDLLLDQAQRRELPLP